MRKDKEDRLWVLLAKQKSGETNQSEAEELNDLLSRPDAPKIDLDLLDNIWYMPVRKKRFSLFPMAAAIVLVAGAALFFFLNNRNNEMVRSLNSLKTQLILPDGTHVWLHQHSTIRYDKKNFGKDDRKVYISGEAFFDVHKDKNVPMTVYAGNVGIKVLGTTFNVKSLNGKGEVETSLIRGAVEVYLTDNPTRKIALSPSQKVTTSSAKKASEWTYQLGKVATNASTPPLEILWMNKQLIFDNEPFEELAPKLERWFNVKISFEDYGVKKLRFSAVIEQETLQQTLEAMKLSAPFNYSLTKEQGIGKVSIGNKPNTKNVAPY
ncbi:FecR family protein [bacterium A37T11]|nr:FecR family protein [bacterium A37T11]